MEGHSQLHGEYSLVTEDGKEIQESRKFTGSATAYYPNGDSYEGYFFNGSRQGKGIYKHRNGDKYTGFFENNKRFGRGELSYKDGGLYEGYFVNGMKNGQGTCKYANGDFYHGSWKNGKRHGRGVYTFVDKCQLDGLWNIGSITEGFCIWKRHIKYLGNFRSNKPIGDGTYFLINGTKIQGTFTQKELPLEDLPDGNVGETIQLEWKTKKVSKFDVIKPRLNSRIEGGHFQNISTLPE